MSVWDDGSDLAGPPRPFGEGDLLYPCGDRHADESPVQIADNHVQQSAVHGREWRADPLHRPAHLEAMIRHCQLALAVLAQARASLPDDEDGERP